MLLTNARFHEVTLAALAGVHLLLDSLHHLFVDFNSEAVTVLRKLSLNVSQRLVIKHGA